MNLSGLAVKSITSLLQYSYGEFYRHYDDLDMEVGKLRFRQKVQRVVIMVLNLSLLKLALKI